jgi:shikimate kinase
LLKKKLIISTGGGIILNNRESLKKTYNIYLNCNISTLIDRLALSKDRPLMGKNSSIDIKNILKKRENFYINVSNLIIDANGLKKSTVINILDKIKNENNK